MHQIYNIILFSNNIVMVNKGSGLLDSMLKKRTGTMKKILKAHGKQKIKSIEVCRTPIREIIMKVAKFILGDELKQVMEKHSYDQIFHLYATLTLDDGSVFSFDKGETTMYKKGGYAKKETTECMGSYNVSKDITVEQMVERMEKRDKNLYIYSTHRNNCQRFILNACIVLGLSRKKGLKAFIIQRADELLKSPMIRRIVKTITDVAGVVERLAGNGEKKEKPKKQRKSKSKRKTNPWLEYVKKVREGNPELSFKECLKCAKATYKK